MGFNKWWIFHFVVPVCSAVFLPSQCEIHYWGNLRQIQVAMENPPLSSTSVPLKCLFSSGISAASNGTDDAKEGMKTNVRFISHYIIEGSLEVKLPTIWTDEKQSREEAERRERLEERRVRRKKMQMREKVGKSRNTVFFQWFGAPEGRKVGSLKRRVRSQLARWEMKNCTPLWHKAHLQVKMYKTPGARSTFGSWDIENAHAVVVQSISKSKCTKHTILGPLLEVQMSKKCTPLWREAHFQVKMYKTHHVRTIFGGSGQAPCQKWPKREGFVAFPRMMAGMGHLKRICKDAFSWQAQYKRHVHERC